jgi:hypothetical protein
MLVHAPIPGQEIVRLRTRTLALCLSTALATSALAASATQATMPAPAVAPNPETRAPAQTWLVENCDDSGPGSLRDVIATQAQSGDTVDLSQLPMSCGMADSLITLGSEIVVSQDALVLCGPTKGTVTISGAGNSRVLHHIGSGTLSLYTMTVADGYIHTSASASGGCIQSDSGFVFLDHVTVRDCTVLSDDGNALGGGISARNVVLVASRVSGNQSIGGNEADDRGWGGGIYSAEATVARYSSIGGNVASSTSGRGVGGGIAAENATLFASTVYGNAAVFGGGVRTFGGSTSVYNSTVSGNEADHGGGFLVSGSLTIANSTIAFNHQNASGSEGGGILSVSGLTLYSSIVANNTAGMSHAPADVYVGQGALAGADNLVMESNVFALGVITVTDDPKLGPLQFNGGPTRTHVLLPGSPALRIGNIDGLLWDTDQRGRGYPRKTGPNANVDIGAVQFDSIFADSFNWAF